MGRRVGRQALTMPMQFSAMVQIAGSVSSPGVVVSFPGRVDGMDGWMDLVVTYMLRLGGTIGTIL